MDTKAEQPSEQLSDSAKHAKLAQANPKTGVCEGCGRERRPGEKAFHYAFLRHPEPYTLSREDYRELCNPCHTSMNKKGVKDPGFLGGSDARLCPGGRRCSSDGSTEEVLR